MGLDLRIEGGDTRAAHSLPEPELVTDRVCRIAPSTSATDLYDFQISWQFLSACFFMMFLPYEGAPRVGKSVSIL